MSDTNGTGESTCIFCDIASGTTPADVVRETDDTIWFHDISPKAPVHILGISKKHIVSLSDVLPEDEAVVGKLIKEATEVAREASVAESGYRIITNVGPNAGQEIPHLHWHVLGGEPLGPMRC